MPRPVVLPRPWCAARRRAAPCPWCAAPAHRHCEAAAALAIRTDDMRRSNPGLTYNPAIRITRRTYVILSALDCFAPVTPYVSRAYRRFAMTVRRSGAPRARRTPRTAHPAHGAGRGRAGLKPAPTPPRNQASKLSSLIFDICYLNKLSSLISDI
ncbi:MAG: hypothetical protein LBM98_12525 [Oscillospiraceae bacterium]|nr:hypothetical protein [Oscillospiraceae bacterium]